MSAVGKNLERFRQAVGCHDRENPDHEPAHGIGMSAFDLDRLGFDDGEVLWPGVHIEIDGKTSGNFRVLCNGVHGGDKLGAEAAREDLVAVGVEEARREIDADDYY